MAAVPFPVAIASATEYYAFEIRIDHSKTTGADACAGCTTPACIVLNQIDLIVRDGQFATRYALFQPVSSYSLRWQGYLAGCPFIVPTRNTTWGQIKSQYR